MAKKIIVRIERSIIARMLNGQQFLRAFPFLMTYRSKGVARAQRSCRCGGVPSPKYAGTEIDDIKRDLANMAPDKKKELLRLLKADEIQIKYPKATGPGSVLKVIS